MVHNLLISPHCKMTGGEFKTARKEIFGRHGNQNDTEIKELLTAHAEVNS